MNKYTTSTGERVSEATIKSRLSATYRSMYDYHPMCAGCGRVKAQGSAHIIPKARCKVLHKTDWIWAKWNIFPACYNCNRDAETHGDRFNALLNKDYILNVLYEKDRETFIKKTSSQ